MKIMHIYCRLLCLLITLGLCTHYGLADISLKLRENNGYLPPPSQHLDNTRYNSQQQQHFQEANYGNSQYPIFEVHNHYQTSPQQQAPMQATQSPYTANGYLAPHEGINAVNEVNNQLNAENTENEDNLNISFLSYAAGESPDGQQITLTEKIPGVGPAPAQAAGNSLNIPFPSNFKHDFQNKNTYNAPEYLPPTQATIYAQQQPRTLRQPVTPAHHGNYQQQQPQQNINTYHAPQYLPPQSHSQQHHSHHSQSPQATASVYGGYRQQTTPPQNVQHVTQPLQKPQFQAPAYLPPRRGQGRQRYRPATAQPNNNHVHTPNSQVQQHNALNYRAPEYLPPHQNDQQQPLSQQTTAAHTNFGRPENLPPNEQTKGVRKQQQQPQEQQQQQFVTTTTTTTQSQQQNTYQAPAYLPPNETTTTTLSTSAVATTGVGALPGGYDFVTPADKQTQTTVTQHDQQYTQNTYQPGQSTTSDFSIIRNPSTPAGFLPAGYDYKNPEENLKTTPTYRHNVQQQQQQQEQQQQGQNEEQEIPGTATTFGYQQQQQQKERQITYHYSQQQQQQQQSTLPLLPAPTPSIVQEIFHEEHFLPAGYDSPQPPQTEQPQEAYEQRPLPTPSIETQEETAGYLPPGYNSPPSEAPLRQQQNYQQSSYAMPQPTPSIMEEITFTKPLPTSNAGYQLSTFLPSGYDSPSPATSYEKEHAAKLLHSQQQNAGMSVDPQTQPQQDAQTRKRLPGDLPDGYDFVKPDNAEEAIAELHSLQRMLEAEKKAQQEQQQQQQQHQYQQNSQQQYRSQSLPQQFQQHNVLVQTQLNMVGDIIYGKSAPNAQVQQNIAYVPANVPAKSTILSPVPQQTPNQPIRNTFRQQKQPQQEQQQQPQQLPTMVQTQSQSQYNQPQQPQPLQRKNQPLATTPQNNGYLPPQSITPAPSALEPHMHTLSSFMTTIQPFDRYGNAIFNTPRKPFLAYGPPTASTAPTFQQPLSSVYAQHNAVQQHYAPAMPYAYNQNRARVPAYTTFTYKQQQQQQQPSYTLSPEARETLQKFMPKDLQPHIAQVAYQANQYSQPTAAAAHHGTAQPPPPLQPPKATLRAAQTSTAKIRTVQIFNPNAIKTLKVLETLDHKGVKTLKILGPSNEDPMGAHRIINVVSQSPHNANESHIQTVKIYNDHKEVDLNANGEHQALSSVNINNNNNNNSNNNDNNNNRGYLPPIATSTVRVARQLHKPKSARFTGRRRYRH